MFRNILWDIPKRWVESPQAPDRPLPLLVEHVFRCGFPAPAGRLFLHIRAEKRMAVGDVWLISNTAPRPFTAIF